MADNNNNNNNNAGNGDLGVSFENWLEELWKPFEGDRTPEASPTPPPASRYNPYLLPRIECGCPNGPGTKPARHWRTKCPFNPQRRVAACEVCARPFNRIDNLKRHLRVVHGTTS